MVSLAERLAECMSLNLGLDGGLVRDTFAPPFVGTKVAMYPACPRPDLVWGLRAHTDAGGIILLLQDGVLPGRPRVGSRRPHQGQQDLRQPRGPAGGDERRRLQERAAPRGRRRRGTAAVGGDLLQPRG
ncbi:hypothetical protein VPH35_126300 [Triticum aestivum]